MPNKTFTFPITLELIDCTFKNAIQYKIKIGGLEYFIITEHKGVFSVRDEEGADYYPSGFKSLESAIEWFVKYLQGA